MPRGVVWVVESDPEVGGAIEEHLASGGYKVRLFSSMPAELATESGGTGIDLVISRSGLVPLPAPEFIEAMARRNPIVLIGDARGDDVAHVIECMKAGAADYLIQPVVGVTLLGAVHRALRYRFLETRVTRLEDRLSSISLETGGLVGGSMAMSQLRMAIDQAARSFGSVMILGETGVGKELVSREIHRCSGRKGEFIAVNTASLSDTLFESEMFGHEPGSFTGAQARKTGLVELADRGTLFLDEIGDMATTTQARILRFLDRSRFRRVGGLRELEVDIRVIAATNREIDPQSMGAESPFRSDLFYRLAGFVVRVPPLRSRTDDLPALWKHFASSHSERHHKSAPCIEPEGFKVLASYPWPGNVREFRNFAERLFAIYAEGTCIPAKELAELLAATPSSRNTTVPMSYHEDLSRHVAEFDRRRISETLARHKFNVTAAARELGMDRKTLHSKIKAHGLG